MIDLSGLNSLLFLVGVITVPAAVVFGVMTYFRIRNAKFRHKHRARHRHSDDQ